MVFYYQTIQKDKDSDKYYLSFTNIYFYIKNNIIYDIKTYNNTVCEVAEHNHKVKSLKELYLIKDFYTSKEAAIAAYEKLPFMITMKLKNSNIIFVNLANYISDGWCIDGNDIQDTCGNDIYKHIKNLQENEIVQDLHNRKLTINDDIIETVNKKIPNIFKPVNNTKIDNIYMGSTVVSITKGNGTSTDNATDIEIILDKDDIKGKLNKKIAEEVNVAAKNAAIKIVKSYGFDESVISACNITLNLP